MVLRWIICRFRKLYNQYNCFRESLSVYSIPIEMVLTGSVASAILIALVAYYFPELLKRPKETQFGKVAVSYDFIIVGAGSAGSKSNSN